MAVPTIAHLDDVQGSGGNVTLSSSGVSDGDWLIVSIGNEEELDTFTDDSGEFTYIGIQSISGTRAVAEQLWIKLWETGNSTSHLFTFSGSGVREAIIYKVSGADSVSAEGDSAGASVASSTASIEAITETTDDFFQYAIAYNWQWNAMATPSGWTLLTTLDNASETYERSDQTTSSATISVGSSNGWATWRIAIVPTQAGAGGDAVVKYARRRKMNNSPLLRM